MRLRLFSTTVLLNAGVAKLIGVVGLIGAVFAATVLIGSALARQNISAPAVPTASDTQSVVSIADRKIASLQDHLRQYPSDHKSATALGLAYLERARETSDPSYYTRADGILNQALAEAPEDADTLIGLGALALARHQFQDAVWWGQRAIAANDYKAAAYGVLGDAYTELGRYEDAVATFQKMIDVRPDQTSYARVSYARELHGDMKGAIAAMQAAVGAAPP